MLDKPERMTVKDVREVIHMLYNVNSISFTHCLAKQQNDIRNTLHRTIHFIKQAFYSALFQSQ